MEKYIRRFDFRQPDVRHYIIIIPLLNIFLRNSFTFRKFFICMGDRNIVVNKEESFLKRYKRDRHKISDMKEIEFKQRRLMKDLI